ncbi:MAG: hypothetical protein R3C15_16200 [Thermoleophilia bacterium]
MSDEIRAVAGPPAQVVEVLARASIEAEIADDGVVEVRGATAAEVDRALRLRAAGDVRFRLLP